MSKKNMGNLGEYDPSTATTTDKVFVSTMLKTITSDERILSGLPKSVSDYLEYTVNNVIDKINAEITLDLLKTLAGKKDE